MLVVADVVGQVVMATEAGTVAVVREGRIVGSKVLGTSGEWKKQNINQNHIMQTKQKHK